MDWCWIRKYCHNDFLAVNALFHEKPLTDVLRPRTKRLIEIGLVEHVSHNKYVLALSLYEVAGNSSVYTRIVGLDQDTNKELIPKWAAPTTQN